ncbi:MAG: 30S ribosome-binding factor RbfA [Saccharospirillaceae bacterium]|nr:30S ribosome-binding factor RbfA [Pseudomonadales bacterium]NRB77963.1 30S ribosome-binding factor RbfA [Saccharospirillaceae bacterium]
MAKEYARTDRVADQIQKDVANIIQREVKDPRIGMVTINQVTISKDLSYAELYFTCMPFGSQADVDEPTYRKECVKVLNNASSFLRTQLGKGLKLRIVPELRFHYDAVIERATHVSSLISQAVNEDALNNQDENQDDNQDSNQEDENA